MRAKPTKRKEDDPNYPEFREGIKAAEEKAELLKISQIFDQDELIEKINSIGADSNNAVALTMNALSSVFTSQATTAEAESSLSLELLQAAKLKYFVTGKDDLELYKTHDYKGDEEEPFITERLKKVYHDSSQHYQEALIASQETKQELAVAKDNLSTARASLVSSQAALAAANAAALAS